MSLKSFFLLTLGLGSVYTCGAQSSVISSAEALIRRTVPAEQAKDFILETIPGEAGKDVFEIEQGAKHRIILRGNNGVAIASALNHYLNEYCHFQITWNGTHVDFFADQRLPEVPVKVHKATPYISLLSQLLHL